MPQGLGKKQRRHSERSQDGRASSSKVDGGALAAVLAARKSARRLYSAREIDAVLSRMAGELVPLIAQANPVVLTVMNGGAFTALELCRHFDFPHEQDYVHVMSYGRREVAGRLLWRVRPRAKLAGRSVLVVDDVLDRGRTLHAIQRSLDAIGVAKQYSAVLVRKRTRPSSPRPKVDVVGVDIEDLYVFGSGMDFRGYWRSLRGLYALENIDE